MPRRFPYEGENGAAFVCNAIWRGRRLVSARFHGYETGESAIFPLKNARAALADTSQRSSGNWPAIASASVISRMTRAGTPAAKELAGMLLVTTLPAPMTQLSPIVTPGHTATFAPNRQSLPMVTGLA